MPDTQDRQGSQEPLRAVLGLLCAKLDASLRVSDPRPDPLVILSNVVDHEGRMYEAARDKLVVSLVGIQHETTIGAPPRAAAMKGDQYGQISQPLYINLLLLFIANFYDQNYIYGLDMISRVIGFFQQTPAFNHETLPDLDTTIDKLTLEMVNLDLAQTNHLLGMVGMKYLPAVLYRLRMIPFRGEAFSRVIAPARGLLSDEAPNAKVPGA
jgi:hypothetical protein